MFSVGGGLCSRSSFCFHVVKAPPLHCGVQTNTERGDARQQIEKIRDETEVRAS